MARSTSSATVRRPRLITKLEDMIQQSDVTTSDVGEQRERNHRYYTLQPMGNEVRGRSHYVDPTVLSSVEGKKALFSETFLSSRQVVKFSGGRAGADEAAAKTAYVNGVFKKNHYERLFRDAWHDAFVAKRCAVWLDWQKDTEITELRFQGATDAMIQQQLQGLGQIVNMDGSQLQSFPIPSIGQQQFVYTGLLRVEVDKSYVGMELMIPEKFYRDPTADYPDTAMWNTYELEVSRGSLVEDGYFPDQVARLTRDYTYSGREEDYARKRHDQSYSNDYQMSTGKEQEIVTIYKTRAWLVIDEDEVDGYSPPDGNLALYEIHWAKGEVLYWADESPAIRRIDEMYVYEWAEMKISHAEFGICTSDVEASSQKNLSVLKRGIIDNMHMVNNTRYEAVRNRLDNPRDLLDNIIGGVVWSDQVGSVAPLATPQLSPMTMPALEMLSRDSEERSGLSSLAKGMNADAISNQNADRMIERLTNAGTRRVTSEARDFARTFLVPVMQCVVRMAMKWDTSVDQMEAAGKVIPIIPSQWQDDMLDVDIAVALTPDEAASMAQKMILVHQMKSQDEQIGPMYGIQQRHAFYDSLYELFGIQDSMPFLLSPQSQEFAQVMQQQQQAAQQAQMEAQQMQQFQQSAIMDNSRRLWAELNNKIMDTVHDNQLDDDRFDHEVYKDNAELLLEAEQKRGVNVG